MVFKTPPVRRDSAGWRAAGIELSENDFHVVSSKNLELIALRPAYPVFVGICFRVFGKYDNAVRLVQVLLSAFVALLVYSFASRYYGNDVGFTAGLLYSFCPTFAHYPGFFLTDNLIVFLFVLSCWLVMKAIDTQNMLIAACAAVSLTLTLLTKPVFLFLGPFVVLMLAIFYAKHVNWNGRLVGIMTIIALLPIICFSGWLYRIHKHDPIIMQSGGGIGYNLLYNGSELALSDKEKAARFIGLISRNLSEKMFPDIDFRTLWPYPAIVQRLKENADRKYSQLPNRKDRYLQMALELYKEHPFGYFINRITTLIRLNAFQYPSRLNETDRWKDFYNRGNNKSLLVIILDLVLKSMTNPFIWFLCGIVVIKRKKLPILPILLPALYINTVYCLLDGIPRYGLPALPFYLIGGAVLFYFGIKFLQDKWVSSRRIIAKSAG
ncbi:MAG: glycosyltransferase family 39 protein [Desulfobacteraceae bacterium]|nr:glycosyltransferase family 39 protein [Desulfobacteraceae bacterium]